MYLPDVNVLLALEFECYDRLIEDTRFEWTLEPPGLEHYWRRLTLGSSYSPKIWTDRYLAA